MSDRLEKDARNADPEWALVEHAIESHVSREIFRHEKMWAYYRNPIELVRRCGAAAGAPGRGWYRSAQEVGLPSRIVGIAAAGGGASAGPGSERGRREVVIENDIGWRVQTMVDFMFGSPVRIESLARDEKTRRAVESVLETIWEASGGAALMQDLATLGHVFGHVDLLVRIDESGLAGSHARDAGRWVSIEPIDARRGVAVMSDTDYRRLDAYAVHVEQRHAAHQPGAQPRRGGLLGGRRERARRPNRSESAPAPATEVFTREGWARFAGGQRTEGGPWSVLAGVIPVVHIQNMSQPFVYGGIGEVEPLVGLQDELNTRLSDRASRVTMQSFKS